LVACANVVNLELATVLGRARLRAIELSLGASRGLVVRGILFEGLVGLVLATVLAAVLAWLGTSWIWAHLPERMTTPLLNGIDVDARSLGFMIAIAAGVWLATSLPIAFVVARSSVLDLLKHEARGFSVSRGSLRIRQWLTGAQIAMTVVLLIGALLSARSYAALLAIPKGFDTNHVLAIAIRPAPGQLQPRSEIQTRVVAALRGRADVVAASVVGASPPETAGSVGGEIRITGRPDTKAIAVLGMYEADADYFSKTMRQPLLGGREFQPGDPLSAVIVDERFAAKFWPHGDAIGAEFKVGGGAGWYGANNGFQIIGIARHVRTVSDPVSGASDEFFPIYRQPDPDSLGFAARVRDESASDEVRAMLGAVVPGAIVTVETIRERYTALFANEMLAASIATAFGLFALVIALAGVYGVMGILVAAREKELGIRIAIGADCRTIRRMLLGSSGRLIVVGTVVGITAALAGRRWVESLFFGVQAGDPLVYAVVAAAVTAGGLLATWQPARRATRIDPLRVLRAE
jgi:predicted permease